MVLEVNSNSKQMPTRDKYEESVNFQNDCRSFYLHRVKATETFKKKMSDGQSEHKTQRKTSIATAMDKLRSEMASLVDQDLSLMKQLLTMNEAIEELKTKRLYGVSKESVDGSTCQLGKSMSTLSLCSEISSESSESNSEVMSEDDGHYHSVKEYLPVKGFQHQSSRDSGYGE